MWSRWGEATPAGLIALILSCFTLLLSFLLALNYRAGCLTLLKKSSHVTAGRRLCLLTVYCNVLGQVLLIVRESMDLVVDFSRIAKLVVGCVHIWIQFSAMTLLTWSAIHRYERIHMVFKGTAAKRFLHGMQYCTLCLYLVGCASWILLDPVLPLYNLPSDSNHFIEQHWIWPFLLLLVLLWNMVCVVALDFSMMMTTLRLKKLTRGKSNPSNTLSMDHHKSQLLQDFKLKCGMYYGVLIGMDVLVLILILVSQIRPDITASLVNDLNHIALSLLSVHVFCSMRLLAFVKDGIRKGPKTKASHYVFKKGKSPIKVTTLDLIQSPMDRLGFQDRTVDIPGQSGDRIEPVERMREAVIGLPSMSLVEDTLGLPSRYFPSQLPEEGCWSQTHHTESTLSKPSVLTQLWTKLQVKVPSLLSPTGKASIAYPPPTPNEALPGPSRFSRIYSGISPIAESPAPDCFALQHLDPENIDSESMDEDSFN